MEKTLFFLRHALAVDRENWDRSDAERPLTPDGKKKMIQEAKGMKKLSLTFEAVMSSPYRRAFETAQVVQAHLPYSGSIETVSELEPGGDLEAFLRILRKRKEKSFLLVGHEPSMSFWIQTLLGARAFGSIEMKKGALCQVKLNLEPRSPPAELVFLLPPKFLRQLGK